MLRVLMAFALVIPLGAQAGEYVEPSAVEIDKSRAMVNDALKASESMKTAPRFIDDLTREREAMRTLGPLTGTGINIPYAKSPKPLFDAVEKAGQEMAQASPGMWQAPGLIVLISLSMPEPQVKALLAEAKRFGAMVALRGVRDGDFLATANYLRELAGDNGDGIVIDPNLFRRFSVTNVPTFIMPLERLTPCTDTVCDIPAHTRATGSSTISYFLDLAVRMGSAKEREIASGILEL